MRHIVAFDSSYAVQSKTADGRRQDSYNSPDAAKTSERRAIKAVCDDCFSSHEISRRKFLWTPPALLAASLVTAVEARSRGILDLNDVQPVSATQGYAGEQDRKTIEGICRDAWRAEPPTHSYRRHKIERLTVHHSGSIFWRNREAPARFRAMQRDHQAEGWPDIAYHILIDRHGNVYRARPPWAKGNTRTNYNPRGHLLVMCIGNFDEQDVRRGQLNALINVLAWACARFDVKPRRIGGHRDYASTACPGDRLYRYLRNGVIHQKVRRRVGEVRMKKLCGRAGRRRVRAIEAGRD